MISRRSTSDERACGYEIAYIWLSGCIMAGRFFRKCCWPLLSKYLSPWRLDMSTIIFTKMVSPWTYPPWQSSLWDINVGQPDAMFISDVGLLKLELCGSGRKQSYASRILSWSRSLKWTFWVNGHGNNASYSPRMMTKNTDTCVSLPIPSPLG